jgi:Leucine-rich repeat (LRR) protein
MKLDYNFLNSLPHKIDKLSKLEYLSASQNNLKLIPPTLTSLGAKFKVLILNDNKI